MLEPSNLYVEKVCLSLVREYVIRRDFRKTLAVLNEETAPLNPKLGFYSSRLHLGHDLGMEGLMRDNKESRHPLKSMLEVLVKCFLQDRELLLRSTFAKSCYYRSGHKRKAKKETKTKARESGLIVSFSSPTTPPASFDSHRHSNEMSSPPRILASDQMKGYKLQKEAKPMKTSKVLTNNEDVGAVVVLCRKRLEKEAKITTNHSRTSLSLEGSRDASSAGDGDDYDNVESWIPEESKSRSRLEHSASVSLLDRRPASPLKRSDRTNSEVKDHHSLEERSNLLLGQHLLESKQNLLAQVSLSPVENEIRQKAQEESVSPTFLSDDSTTSVCTSKNGKSAQAQTSSAKSPAKISSTVKSATKSSAQSTTKSSAEKKSPSSSSSSVKSTTVTTDQGFKIRDVDSLQTPSESQGESDSSMSSRHISSAEEPKSQMSSKFIQKSSVSSELVTTRSTVTKILDQGTWQKLKTLVLGERANLPEGWVGQGFGFNYHIPYGLIQKKGGPCGVLTAVQAILLKSLIFGSAFVDPNELPVENFDIASDHSTVTELSKKRSLALIGTLTEILWRCKPEINGSDGSNSGVTVGLTSTGSNFGPGSELRQFFNLDSLKTFVEANLYRFDCIGLVYSAVLSRGIDLVHDDMDFGSSPLLGQHGYCTQELMSLLLMGQAISNTFDNDVVLDDHRLKGMPAQGEIGLLSLFEHYNSCKVGSFVKNPKFPLWIICSESHFSLLFSDDMNLTPKLSASKLLSLGPTKKLKSFHLFYYDGLARQEKIIKLTINPTTTKSSEDSVVDDDELVPPLEKCIRTKWKDVQVDWNDTEPIL